jgi:hypothetical protein
MVRRHSEHIAGTSSGVLPQRCPVLGALIFSRLGWPALFAVYAGAYLAAGSMWFIIDPTEEFYKPSDDVRSSD